jgi:oligopeptide/dipeptide ABC transporter ATP-binding protein
MTTQPDGQSAPALKEPDRSAPRQARQAGGLREGVGQPLLTVKDLCKHFPIHSKGFVRRVVGAVKAVDGVSFHVMPGETLGLVGESGCGKTTTGRTVLRALRPTAGQVLFRANGKVVDLAGLGGGELKPLRRKMQMMFQDPFSSLNPRMTVGSIVGEPLVIHGLARGSELKDRVAEMLKMVGLNPEHGIRYPHAFSGGQRQRAGIARALIMRPSLVIADEPVSALDVSVQAQIINLMERLQAELNLTYVFIAHDLSVVRHICDRVAVMYAGKIVELAETEALFADPKHPYTKALLSAVPVADPDKKMNFALTGEAADPANLPSGCPFHPRCPMRFDLCTAELPPLNALDEARQVACHKVV